MSSWSRGDKIAVLALIVLACACVANWAVVPWVHDQMLLPGGNRPDYLAIGNFLISVSICVLLLLSAGNLTALNIDTFLEGQNPSPHGIDPLRESYHAASYKMIFGVAWFALWSLLVDLVTFQDVNLTLNMISRTWLLAATLAVVSQLILYGILLSLKRRR